MRSLLRSEGSTPNVTAVSMGYEPGSPKHVSR